MFSVDDDLESEPRGDPVERALAGEVGFAAQAASALRASADAYRNLAERATAGLRTALTRIAEDRVRTSRAIATVMEQWARALPPNWPPDRFEDAMQFVAETRWPIVWVPESHVVTDLLDGADREAPSLLARPRSLLVARRCSDRSRPRDTEDSCLSCKRSSTRIALDSGPDLRRWPRAC
jgi:hypothetical protein